MATKGYVYLLTNDALPGCSVLDPPPCPVRAMFSVYLFLLHNSSPRSTLFLLSVPVLRGFNLFSLEGWLSVGPYLSGSDVMIVSEKFSLYLQIVAETGTR